MLWLAAAASHNYPLSRSTAALANTTAIYGKGSFGANDSGAARALLLSEAASSAEVLLYPTGVDEAAGQMPPKNDPKWLFSSEI
jgi:hypothetical protein